MDKSVNMILLSSKKFEWYLRYKYEKTGKAFKPFNMRKLLLEENY